MTDKRPGKALDPMVSLLAAAALALHGLIHLIGFVVPWGIAALEGFPYRTTALGGTLVLGEAGARAVGVAWLLLAVGFVVDGIATRLGRAWAAPLAAGLAIASIAVCVLGLPEAGFGIVVNLVILGVVARSALARGRAAGVLGS